MRQLTELSQVEINEIGENFLQRFSVVIKQVQFYPEDHPILKETLASFRQLLKAYLEEYGKFQINFFEGEVFVYQKFAPELGKGFLKLTTELEKKGVREISILAGVTEEEIYNFCLIINDKPENIEASGGIQTMMADAGITHIVVTESLPSDENKMEEDLSAPEDLGTISEETYLYAVSVVKEVADQVLAGKPIKVHEARRLVDNMVESVLSNPDTLIRLATLKNYDEDTFYHSVNVMILSLLVGTGLGFEKTTLSAIGISALLHDIGKIKIPPDIVKKPTSLTREEWEVMQSHTILGAEVLLEARGVNKIALVVALEHHYGYDGKGYPRLYLVNRPHIFARIVEVVDVYDSLTSQRAYRKPALPDNALRLIHAQAGKKLDPVISKNFIRIMGIYPVGSVVKLNTSEYAVVMKPGKEDITRPVVQVVIDANGEKLTEPIIVDLLKEARNNGKRTAILEAVDPLSIGIDPKQYVVNG